VLATLFAYTMRTLPSTSPPAGAGETAFTIDVVGRQWFWDVSYPGQDVRTANEIHIPVGVRVAVKVSTKDVLHSFWVPRLNRKMDMIPGQENTLLLEADAPGTYRGQCAEYCGLQHAHMAFLVVAEPRADFDAWLAAQSRPASAPTSESERRGRGVFLSSACADCHTVSGTDADARVGPDLTHFASRRTIGAGTIPNRKGYLGGWILDPQHLKPGNKMPGITFNGSDFQALLDYVESLR
jgi:cytochrome c oxidase subunit 2